MDGLDLFAEAVEAAEAASLTQRAIVDTQQNLGKMLDLMPIGLLIHTEQGIVFANRRHAASYRAGWPSSEGNTFWITPPLVMSIPWPMPCV